MKNLPFNRSMAARWQLHLKKMTGMGQLEPQRVASDNPPYEEEDERYALMLRRREHWLNR